MKLYDDLKQELDQESTEQAVRLSVGLSGRAAEAFLALHGSLGGQQAISRNGLASRILSRALAVDEPRKQRRAINNDESTLRKVQDSDLKSEDL